MKQLLLIMPILSAVLMLTTGDCTFDPIDACSRNNFDLRPTFFARDACNCSVFWQCEITSGRIVTYRRECPPCLCFNNNAWTCSDHVPPMPGRVCLSQPPVAPQAIVANNTDSCSRNACPSADNNDIFKAVAGDDTSFIWIVAGIALAPQRCPPGTYFDFANLCQCVACPSGRTCAFGNTRIFRMNFDNYTEMQGIYIQIDGYLTTVPGGVSGLGEQFGGAGDIAIPYFRNTEFCDFTFSLWFKRDASQATGEQGLVFNGNNVTSGCFPATIRIMSTGNTVSATIITSNTTVTITHPSVVTVGVFHHVVLRYKCTQQLDLFVDGIVQSSDVTGPTRSNKCPLMIGHSFDSADNSQYFTGIVDEVRFYREALQDVDIRRLFILPGSNP